MNKLKLTIICAIALAFALLMSACQIQTESSETIQGIELSGGAEEAGWENGCPRKVPMEWNILPVW